MTEKEEHLYQDRLKKLKTLVKEGIDPYPAKCSRTHTIARVLLRFLALSKAKKPVILVGRIRAIRTHGGLVFGNLEDGTGSLQFMMHKNELGKEKFESLGKLFDLGDFLEASGTLVTTQRGEKTLQVRDFRMLAKSLCALPEKWHGLTDIETRLRRRYLDMIANPETRELFKKKAKFWKALREYLERRGFLEVDTPALEDIPGGAEARPFITHHNALDRDFYLRISLELPLKKIIIGGFEKIYEIGKVFRNEGVSPEHLQDYLECEFYWAYADYGDLMKFVEDLYKHVIKETVGSLKTKFGQDAIDWGKKWPKLDYFEIVEKEIGKDLTKLDDNKLKDLAGKLGLEIPGEWGRGRIIDYIFKKKVRPKILEPTFLINHPIEVSPLAKRNPYLPGRVERVQVIAAGTELGNGWSELNDPLDQRERFLEQMKLREQGDEEAQMMDESFVAALEYGMPPTAGFGLSERLFSVLMNKSARETVIFPPMRKLKDD